mgnify:CR=1 FL=1
MTVAGKPSGGPARDVLGREIHPGDAITYPGRHSSQLYVSVGIVVEVAEKSLKIVSAIRSWRRPDGWDVASRMSTINLPERSTIVDPSAIASDPDLLPALSAAYRHRAGSLPPWHPELASTAPAETIAISDIRSFDQADIRHEEV